MLIYDYICRNLPQQYYPTMYQDGYTPEQILMTVHRDMYERFLDRQEDADPEIVVTSEVTVKE